MNHLGFKSLSRRRQTQRLPLSNPDYVPRPDRRIAVLAAGARGARSLNRLVGPHRISRAIFRLDSVDRECSDLRLSERQSRPLPQLPEESILQSCQVSEAGGLTIVAREQQADPFVDTFIDQQLHEARASRSFRASSSASRATARETVGNPNRKSSRLSPPSRYSKRVWTGTRVPRKTGTPCIVSGSEVILKVTTSLSLSRQSPSYFRCGAATTSREMR